MVLFRRMPSSDDAAQAAASLDTARQAAERARDERDAARRSGSVDPKCTEVR